MTELLEKAITEVFKLPASLQDAIAAMILDEIDDEQQWDIQFANTQDSLAKWAKKAQDDFKAGRVRKIGFDDL